MLKFVEISYKGNDTFVEMHHDRMKTPLPYGEVTEYIHSLKLQDVDYNALKKAYKVKGVGPVRLAKRPIGLGHTSRFVLEVSEDHMACHLILLPPRENEQVTNSSIIFSEMKKKGVVFGIQEEGIKKAIADKIFKKRVIGAKGQAPIPGEDTHIKALVSSDANLIDFLPRFSEEELYEKFEFLKPVTTGERIADIKTASSGTPGTTVYGTTFQTISGETRDIVGSNIEIKKNKIFAGTNGRVLLTPTGIDVEPILVLDYAMNQEVRFKGSIRIMGDVESCPIIQATGDIEIFGVVSDTPLEAGRNIIIHENLLSHQEKIIRAGRDFVGRNVFHANITAENILVLSTILNSELTAFRAIRTLGPDGSIVGGHARAGKSIRSQTIGDKKGGSTQLSVATPQIMREFKPDMTKYYTQQIEELKRKKSASLKKVKRIDNKRNRLGEKNPAVYNASAERFRIEIDNFEKEISGLLKEIVKIKDPKLTLMTAEVTSQLFYPNTLVAMGRVHREINEPREKIRFLFKEGNMVTELLEESK